MKKIGKIIHAVNVKMKRKIDRLAQEYDITSVQFIVLECLFQELKGRDVFQRDLEVALDVRRSTISNVLGLLEKKGYVKRESVASDARLKKLTLTPAGEKIYLEFEARLSRSEAEDLQVFTEEETETLIELLNRLSNAVQ